jgi:O-succinylbenzoic acid--CoA ligase
VTSQLVALDLPGGAEFVDALRRVWDRGDAAFPVDRRLPAAGQLALLAAMAPAAVIDPSGEHTVSGGRPVEPGDALVVATSGSTGEPKGAVLVHDAIRASALATSERLSVTDDDHWLACLPLAHVGGLSVVTRAIHTGTTLTVLPRFDVDAVEAAARDGATLVSLVATALGRIDASLFRTIVLGGSAPPPDRPANTVTTYGMTETGSGVVYDGVPLDGVDVRVDAGGEIHLRGPMLLRAYRDGRDPFVALDGVGGWLPTGDVGRWLDDGRLHVDGRRGDLIITGGENVWPDAVERALRTDPRVGDVAVTGTTDPEWGQIVTAYVVPAGLVAPTLDDLRRAAKESLPAYCAPRALYVVDAIPRTALGKTRRTELRP